MGICCKTGIATTGLTGVVTAAAADEAKSDDAICSITSPSERVLFVFATSNKGTTGISVILGDFCPADGAAVALSTAACSLTILMGEASLLLAKKLVFSSLITRGASKGLDSSAAFSWMMTIGDFSRTLLTLTRGDFSLSIGIVRSKEEEEEEREEVYESRFWTSMTTGLGDVTFAGGEGGFVVKEVALVVVE